MTQNSNNIDRLVHDPLMALFMANTTKEIP